ncbi:hypothetical protein MAR_008180 [Mya arenaria]|uniref:Uncharacterized protein n=1 Tax=Mya arenaria TaxID=6604 RepID=A0ABY7DXW0_MYAAR|nr:hypothetical protein MAR_008180 [Mya arenaria]
MNSLINVLDTICFLPLILLSHCGNSVSFEKYIGFKIFDNHTCTAEASLSTTSVVSSIVKCVMDCGHDDRCKSVFYGEDDGACTLCSEVFNYYAHQPAVANVHTKHLRPLQGSCPEGWLRFQYSCYTLTNASNGFHHDECVTMGAHAIYVESIEEQNFLAKTFKPATGGISLIASLALKPPKKKSDGDQRENQKSGCSAKCSKYILSRDLFTDAVFYIVICAYLLDQIGRPIFSEGMQPIMKEKGFSQTKVDIQPFIENGGALLGLLLLSGISLIASLALKPPKKKSDGDQRENQKSGCSAKCSKYILSRDLFTDAVFYIVICAYLLDQIGRPIFSEGMQPIMKEKGFSQTKVDIQPFIENGGALLGLLLLSGISLIASLALKPPKKKSDGDQRENQKSGCSAKCSKYILSRDLFTDAVFYIVICAYLLDQIGRPIFSEGMQPIMKEKGFSQTKVDIQPFIENGGALLGLLLLSEDSFEGQHLLFFFSGACLIVAAVLALISRFVVVHRIDRQQEEAAERIEMEIQNGSRRY